MQLVRLCAASLASLSKTPPQHSTAQRVSQQKGGSDRGAGAAGEFAADGPGCGEGASIPGVRSCQTCCDAHV